jgi:cytochrome c oxidase cbb3-type subunit III
MRPLVVLGIVALLVGCEREERRLRELGPAVQRSDGNRISPLQPGMGSVPSETWTRGPYDENAYALSEGQKLYNAMNCVGCHANGGGGIGPPLMDARWIYGSSPDQIFHSIVEGRPNGMPAYRGKLGDAQVWQLVSYVRSLSGNVRKDVPSARDDHLQRHSPGPIAPREPEKSQEALHP